MKGAVHWLGEQYIRLVLRSQAEAQRPRPINERPVELRFLLKCVDDLQPACVLDVGPGESPLPAVLRNCGCPVTAVDNLSDSGDRANAAWSTATGMWLTMMSAGLQLCGLGLT